eukprot:942066-Heterocapsa_arctica.AAC.1
MRAGLVKPVPVEDRVLLRPDFATRYTDADLRQWIGSQADLLDMGLVLLLAEFYTGEDPAVTRN